jgi:ribonuclease R
MLPEELSNGLCSINPDVERLCMTCEMNIDAEGNLLEPQYWQFCHYHQTKLASQYGQSPSHRVWFSQLLKLYISHTRHLNY